MMVEMYRPSGTMVVEVYRNEDLGAWVAHCADPGLVSQGPTPAAALAAFVEDLRLTELDS